MNNIQMEEIAGEFLQTIDGERWLEERLREVLDGSRIMNKHTVPEFFTDADIEEAREEGFDAGVDVGNEQGYEYGFDSGVESGFDEGKDEGKAEGYEEGYKAGWDARGTEDRHGL
jgi:flagellar biosynthesis/type III secretory pathway protein FliH